MMSYVLKARERKALSHVTLDGADFVIKGKFPPGIGKGTLNKLAKLGLFETGPSKRYYGEIGWRLTDDGWRCMYGKTGKEMMAAGQRHHRLRVWKWPPT